MSALKFFSIYCVVGLFMLSLSTACYSAEKWGTCTVQDVMVWDKARLHIRCATAVDGYTFFAVPWSNTEFLSQALSIASAAIAYNKTIDVVYNPSDTTSGPTFNCDSIDCRPLIAIKINR